MSKPPTTSENTTTKRKTSNLSSVTTTTFSFFLFVFFEVLCKTTILKYSRFYYSNEREKGVMSAERERRYTIKDYRKLPTLDKALEKLGEQLRAEKEQRESRERERVRA